MKTIGILGGMGPAATVDFYRRIVESTDATYDQDHLHVIIDSQPAVPDRTAYLLGRGIDPVPTLILMARALQAAGAHLLVMACNTASAFAGRVSAAVEVPLVDWPAEAAAALIGYRPEVQRVGLLATDGTITTGLYQRAFAAFDVEVIVAEAGVQAGVMDAIYGPGGVKAGSSDLSAARVSVARASSALVENGAMAILLACTELSVLYATQQPEVPVPTLDASQLVAERVIVRAGGRLK